MFRRFTRLLIPTGLALATACAGLAAPLKIAASFTIPADLARSVGGDAVTVKSLTPPNSDFHTLQATPAQVRALCEADLVIAVHPEVETWIAQLERAGTLKHPVLYLAKDIIKGDLAGCDHEADAGPHTHDGPRSAESDPHVWMDPDITGAMAEKLASRLAEIDPGKAAAHRAAGAAYAGEMKTLGDDLAKTLAGVPTARRKLVTQHDNLRRFAKRFRFEIAGTLLDSASSEAADPSARRMAGTIRMLRESRIPAVFCDNTLSPDVPAAVAREAGLPAPVPLYIDALDKPGTPAATYSGMMRENARRIAAALTPEPAEKAGTQ